MLLPSLVESWVLKSFRVCVLFITILLLFSPS